MPFGLKNVGATFQRAMTLIFHDLKTINEVYLDDLAAHSHLRLRHSYHLWLVFERCRHYQVHLNPHKCIFCVTISLLLGFIVSKEHIRVDPLKVEAILQFSPLRNIRHLQCLQGMQTSCEGSWWIFPTWLKASCICWRRTPLFNGMSKPRILSMLLRKP